MASTVVSKISDAQEKGNMYSSLDFLSKVADAANARDLEGVLELVRGYQAELPVSHLIYTTY